MSLGIISGVKQVSAVHTQCLREVISLARHNYGIKNQYDDDITAALSDNIVNAIF